MKALGKMKFMVLSWDFDLAASHTFEKRGFKFARRLSWLRHFLGYLLRKEKKLSNLFSMIKAVDMQAVFRLVSTLDCFCFEGTIFVGGSKYIISP
jgi:hypothetical protein